ARHRSAHQGGPRRERNNRRDFGGPERQAATERRNQDPVALLLMCGIAGVVRHGGATTPDPAAALGAALAHRGPDGHGVWRSPGGDVLLVHTRLAIIDPGPSGAQPMATPDGRHRIIFNGEIYNYRELRRSLEARGERFTTGSDTEVLLRLLWRSSAGCSRSPGGTPRRARSSWRAIGSGSSRSMSPLAAARWRLRRR